MVYLSNLKEFIESKIISEREIYYIKLINTVKDILRYLIKSIKGPNINLRILKCLLKF